MNRKRNEFDSYGMRPATLHERLERIQEEIAKLGPGFVPQTHTMAAIHNELLNREAILKAEIAKEGDKSCQG